MNTLDPTEAPTMDITGFREKGKELMDVIEKEVKRMNDSVLYMPLPALLRMTQDQYDDLNAINGIYDPFHSEDKLYTTAFNVMEVRVDKRKRLTFKEAMDLDDKNFDEWEKSEGITHEPEAH